MSCPHWETVRRSTGVYEKGCGGSSEGGVLGSRVGRGRSPYTHPLSALQWGDASPPASPGRSPHTDWGLLCQDVGTWFASSSISVPL